MCAQGLDGFFQGGKFTLISQSLAKVVKHLCQGFRMRNLYFLIIAAFTLIFNGCGPKYAIQKTYHAPPNIHECLQRCSDKRLSCESNAMLDYEGCVVNMSLEARDAYYDALQSYGAQLKHFDMSLWRYERTLERYTHSISRLTCKDDDKKCKPLHVNKPKPPKAPIVPDFEDIFKHYIAPCEPSNKCEVAYEACFSGCGGQIELHKHCISGCD